MPFAKHRLFLCVVVLLFTAGSDAGEFEITTGASTLETSTPTLSLDARYAHLLGTTELAASGQAAFVVGGAADPSVKLGISAEFAERLRTSILFAHAFATGEPALSVAVVLKPLAMLALAVETDFRFSRNGAVDARFNASVTIRFGKK